MLGAYIIVKSIETFRGAAQSWECDFLGHLNTRFYTGMFDQATANLFAELGDALKQLHVERKGWVTAMQHTEYLCEVLAGTCLIIRTQIEKVGNRSLSLAHEMYAVGKSEPVARMAVRAVYFDLESRQPIAIPELIRERANTLRDFVPEV